VYQELIQVKISTEKTIYNYKGIYLVLWQKGLVEREINELLRGLVRDDDERNKSNNNHTTKVKKKFFLFVESIDIVV
jgi:hypothetical protein